MSPFEWDGGAPAKSAMKSGREVASQQDTKPEKDKVRGVTVDRQIQQLRGTCAV